MSPTHTPAGKLRRLELSDASAPAANWRFRDLNILFLADNLHAANVVQDHIAAFEQHSRHRIKVVNPIHDAPPSFLDLSRVDLILVHYSIFILSDYFLPSVWRELVRSFPGSKAQIIQDEHRHIRRMRACMAELSIGAVFSSLELTNLQKVYASDDVGSVTFYSCLPGYIAKSFSDWQPTLIADRPFDIVYRGRQLPFKLGRMAQEKSDIGVMMRVASQLHGLSTCIDSTEDSRIYGDAWVEFLMSGKTTLGVEGGASIFDFDDNIEPAIDAFMTSHPGARFEDVWAAVLSPYEGNVEHRTITPKILEAICAKTALILYPGRYRGILTPNDHYIQLERDGSNIDEVVRRIRDTHFLQDLVDRTHTEISERYDLSTRFYVQQVDKALIALHAGAKRTTNLRRALSDRLMWAKVSCKKY